MPIHTSLPVVIPTTGFIELERGSTKFFNVTVTSAGTGTINFYEGYPPGNDTVVGTANFGGSSENLTHNPTSLAPIFTVAANSAVTTAVNLDIQAPLYAGGVTGATTITIDYA